MTVNTAGVVGDAAGAIVTTPGNASMGCTETAALPFQPLIGVIANADCSFCPALTVSADGPATTKLPAGGCAGDDEPPRSCETVVHVSGSSPPARHCAKPPMRGCAAMSALVFFA